MPQGFGRARRWVRRSSRQVEGAQMLALTSSAHEAIEGILGAASIPASAGLRIAPSAGVDAPLGELQLTVAAVAAGGGQGDAREGGRGVVGRGAPRILDGQGGGGGRSGG